MAAVASPVTPAVLSWAVREDGRALDELAEALKVEVDVVDGWVSGDAAPSRGQVSDLARVLRRPRALFFLKQPPATATLPSSFRHPPGVARTISSKVRAIVRQSRQLQQAVAWARRNQPAIDVPVISPAMTSPRVAAAAAREWLAVSAEEQLSWKDDRAALRGWREAMEERGLLVFALQIGAGEIRGFSAWDDRAPLVAANTSRVTPAARSFTLAHELGHLVCRQDATCLEPDEEALASADVERWCEQFGAEFLMPAEMITAIAKKRGIVPGSADLSDVKQVMLRMRVSARAAALRLIDLGWAASSLYPAVLKAYPVASPKEDSSPRSAPRPEARLRAYGPRVISTVFDALPTRDALNLLRIDVDDARSLAMDLPGLRVP